MMLDARSTITTAPTRRPKGSGRRAQSTEFARIWRSKPKIVFSRTLRNTEYGCRLADGDLSEEVAKLEEKVVGDMSVSGAVFPPLGRPSFRRRLDPGRRLIKSSASWSSHWAFGY
jgi:hypothetical protein